MFKDHFPRDASEDDYIECIVDGFRCRATIVRDSEADPPETVQDVLCQEKHCKTRAQFLRIVAATALARAAWKRDEWFMCGVVLTVSQVDEDKDNTHWPGGHREHGDETMLVEGYECAVWGIECNYPSFDRRRRPNTYLREVANELLPEALEKAKAAVVSLVAERVAA